MSAISLDTKQGKVDRILSLFLANMKDSASFLFSGPNGSDKFSKSIKFAKAANCLEKKDDISDLSYCGNCRSCRRIDSGNHPDIMIVEPEDNYIKIDKIRSIIDVVSLKPYDAVYRFIIIKDADCMNLEASNAILKSLEEPPEDTVFVLTSSVKHRLLKTILSRCYLINFSMKEKSQFIKDLMVSGCSDEKECEILSELSNCDIDIALKLKKDGWIDKREMLCEQFFQLDRMGVRDIMYFAEILSADKNKFDIYKRIIVSLLRDIEIIKNNPELIVNKDKIPYIKELSLEMSSESVFKGYQVVSDVEQSLKTNLNLRILIENMLFGLANI